jgi:DNA transposition AAA+ family ATPase
MNLLIESRDAVLIQSLNEAIAQDGISQKSAALQIGIGEAVLSQFMKAAYKGDNAKVAAQIQKWLDNRAVKKLAPAIPTVGYVPTPTSKKIRAVLTMSQHGPNIGVIYGASGAGKTMTAKDYAQQNPNVFLITCSPATNTVGAILDEICWQMGIGKVSGKLSMQREILRRMKGTGGLWIFDESQHLSQSALEQIRTLFDLAEVGMVFMGNEVVYSKFSGGKRSAEFAQLFGRIGKPLHILKPQKTDAGELISAWGIIDDKSVTLLKGIAQKNGGLRSMVHVIKQSYLFAESLPKYDDIMSSWRIIGSGGGVDVIGEGDD